MLGLSDDGKKLVQEMIKRRLLVDVHHMSRRAIADTYAIVEANQHYPIFISHGVLSEVREASDRHALAHPLSTMKMVKRSGGMIGLRVGNHSMLQYSRSGVKNDCNATTKGFAQLYQLARVGLKVPVAMASDFHGFVTQAYDDNASRSRPTTWTRAGWSSRRRSRGRRSRPSWSASPPA